MPINPPRSHRTVTFVPRTFVTIPLSTPPRRFPKSAVTSSPSSNLRGGLFHSGQMESIYELADANQEVSFRLVLFVQSSAELVENFQRNGSRSLLSRSARRQSAVVPEVYRDVVKLFNNRGLLLGSNHLLFLSCLFGDLEVVVDYLAFGRHLSTLPRYHPGILVWRVSCTSSAAWGSRLGS